MRRRVALALAGVLAVGCLKGPTSTAANDIRFDLSAAVSGTTGAVLHVIVSYLLDSNQVATPPLVDTRLSSSTATAKVPLTIDLTPCLDDPRRAGDSPSCQLTVTVTLEQNGTVVDSVTIPTITATPGQTVSASTSVQPIGAVHVGPSADTIAVGATAQLVDTVLSPTNVPVTGVAVTWTSANSQIARVDASGLVTGVGAGTTQVTVTAGNAQGHATITVTTPVTGGGGGLALGVSFTEFSAPSGSTIPLNSIIAVTSTGTEQVSGLVATITYGAGQPTGWLLAYVSDSTLGGARVVPRRQGFEASVIHRQTSSTVTTPGVLDVVPSTTNLNVGTYTATVTVTGGSGESVQLPVTYTITAAAPKLVLTPDTVTFQLYGNGQILPPADTITGSQTGLTVTGYSWIGNTTGYLNTTLTGTDSIMVNPTTTNLPLENLQAYVHVKDANGDTASLFVNVNVTATFTQLAAGGAFTCGVTTGATVYCWGDNTYSQLGIGTTGGQYTTPQPIKLVGATIASVSAGYLHACAITTSNVAFCWGDNSRGQMGQGSLVGGTYSTPVQINFPVSQISLGFYHTCAVTFPTVSPYGAGVYCWGDNHDGQLGTGTADTVAHASPIAVGQTFVSVSAGAYHTCAEFDSNALQVYCWGDNGNGQLAIDSTGSSYPSLHVAANSSGYHAVSAGGFYTCAIDANATVNCAGDNNLGELGIGNYNTPSYLFIPTVPSQLADTIYAGYFHACALRTNVATCWGFDSAGALGLGQLTRSVPTPTAVSGGLSFASLALSEAGYHTCGLTTAGVAYCWGYDAYGQLGIGSTQNTSVPLQVLGQPAAPGVVPVGGSRVVKRPPTVRRQVRR